MSTLTQNNKKRQIVQSLYLCKALMAFLIVTRHTTFCCKDALLPLIALAIIDGCCFLLLLHTECACDGRAFS